MHIWADELVLKIDKTLIEKLVDFTSSKNTYLFIKNCPVGALPETPVVSGFIKNQDVTIPAKTLFALFSIIGIEPISYIGENEGRALRHVVPKQK